MADDHRLARLLSGRPGLSRPEKEEILDAVLADVEAAPAPEEAAERRGWFGILGALVAAAAALVLVLVPAPPDAEDTFAARGAAGGKPQLTVVCAATSAPGRCSTGGELIFELADVRGWSHAAVFAFREDDTVIWYEDDAALEHDGETVLLPVRAKLGAEHPPGHYDVAAVLSTRPLDRATIRRIYEQPAAHRDAVVVEAEVEIR